MIADLKQLNLGTLTALARAIDAKSPWTSGHSERVTGTALEIGREVGLSEVELDALNRGGLLHDIGKIGVDAHVLDKPGKLTDQETTQIREHVNIGGRILEPIPGFAECMPNLVLQHHEWFDGSGYPSGLAGEQISLHARIFAVADCYDAMISDCPYRTGMPRSVLQILRAGTGKQFDPQVMDAFLRLIANMLLGRARRSPNRPRQADFSKRHRTEHISMPKINESNKTRRLIFVAVVAVVALLAMHWRLQRLNVPAELVGTWRTGNAQYADRSLEISRHSITFATGPAI